MNRKMLVLISKHLRFSGSWPVSRSERNTGLSMNLASAERGSVSRSNVRSGSALRLTEPRSVHVAGFRGATREDFGSGNARTERVAGRHRRGTRFATRRLPSLPSGPASGP